MLGGKIKRLREQLGLSQQQVAGKEFTRAFISLVEHDRCKPSLVSLQLIAERLGKPIDYFLEGEDTAIQSAESLIKSARQSLDQGENEMALTQTREAIRMSQRTERLDIESEAQLLRGRCLRRAGEDLAAMEAFETAADGFKVLGSRTWMARAYCEWANCAYAVEEFPLARRLYEKTLRFAEGKSLQELRVSAFLYLGSVLYRLGDSAAATDCYRNCLAECDKGAYPELWGEAAMGLGVMYYRLNRLDEAASSLQQAHKLFQQIRHPQLYGVLHNQALVDAAQSRWEHAYARLQQCLSYYRERGIVTRQAAALEEIGRYWVHKGNLSKAKAALQEAIDLLDVQDDGILRGRLYRELGVAEAKDHNPERARNCLLISCELFRRLKSADEVLQSLNLLRQLDGTQQQVSAPIPDSEIEQMGGSGAN
jgi:tetratricopeptide (TPR) repeat protein